MCIMHEIQVFYCLFSHTYPQEGRRENEVNVCGSIQIFQCGGMVIAEFGVYFVFFFHFHHRFGSSSDNFTMRERKSLRRIDKANPEKTTKSSNASNSNINNKRNSDKSMEGKARQSEEKTLEEESQS